MSQVSLGRPEFVPGTPPGHPTAKFLYLIFFIGFFSPNLKVWADFSFLNPSAVAAVPNCSVSAFRSSKHLLSAFYKTLPSKNPSKNLVVTEKPYRRLLRTLLRSTYCWRTF